MNKKTIIAVLAAFVVGALIGGGTGMLYTTRLTANTLLLLKTGELHESAQQAWQAYFDEPPAVATWAIGNHLGVVQNLDDVGYPHDAKLRLHELASHARLAELASRRGDSDAQASHMAKALAAAERSTAQAFRHLKTEDDVLKFVDRLDERKLP